MKYDEFAFFNQQLAGMLKSGIPLEGALRQLCGTMKRGQLREELQKLEVDLAQGARLDQALSSRKLPDFYIQMVQAGTRGNDLPGMLILLADYYQKVNLLVARLKGLLVYPTLVLLAALALSLFLALSHNRFVQMALAGTGLSISLPVGAVASLWLAPIFLGLLFAVVLAALFSSGIRNAMRWRLPAFKDASLAQLAATAQLMLNRGNNLNEVLQLLRQMEKGTPAEKEITLWQQRLSEGHGRISDMAPRKKIFPPLFFWLADGAGEDLAAGFQRASEIYHGRALYRIELLLYGALPVAVLLLGVMIVTQVYPYVRLLVGVMDSGFSDDGM